MPRQVVEYEHKGEPLSLCRFGCGRRIFFVTTAKGRPMPVDYETKQTHFANCPKYAEIRERQRKRKAAQS